jgi:hypothetical protein
MAADVITQGATLEVDITGAETTYLAVGNVVSWSGPNASRTAIQIGDANSAVSANAAKAGRVTQGSWNFVVNLDPAILATGSETNAGKAYKNMQILSSTINTTPYNWKLTTVDTTIITFDGFASNFSIDGADDGNITASFTVTMVTPMTVAATV